MSFEQYHAPNDSGRMPRLRNRTTPCPSQAATLDNSMLPLLIQDKSLPGLLCDVESNINARKRCLYQVLRGSDPCMPLREVVFMARRRTAYAIETTEINVFLLRDIVLL